MKMLHADDVQRIFQTLSQRGYLWSEIYAERRTHVALRIRERVEEVRQATVLGFSIRCFDGTKIDRFDSNSGDFSNRLFQGRLRWISASAVDVTPALERTSAVMQAGRQAQVSVATAQGFRADYDETLREFAVWRSGSEQRQGTDSNATIDVAWKIETEEHQSAEHLADASLDPAALVSEWTGENGLLLQKMRTSLEARAFWPAPRAELPVLWSAKAVARLFYLFTRGFEGDLVLRDRSFLNEAALPLEIGFALEDRPETDRAEFDHEGSARRKIRILQEGKPRALAVDSRRAEQFEVPPTGHARRQGFEFPPTIACWRLGLTDDTPRSELLAELVQGVFIGDFRVLRYDLNSSQLSLKLQDSQLIHQGQLGEAIEGVVWETDLIELLSSLVAFGREDHASGFALQKDGQKLVVNVEAPAALSRPVGFPGTVPASHYW